YRFFDYGMTVVPGPTTVLPFTIWMLQLPDTRLSSTGSSHDRNAGAILSNLRHPRRPASMVVMSIFFIGIIASKARYASRPPAASASVNARGVICQERPQRSLHQPHWLSLPPLPTIAFQ